MDIDKNRITKTCKLKWKQNIFDIYIKKYMDYIKIAPIYIIQFKII